MVANQQIAVVVIGRNEGDRLKRCIASLQESSGQQIGPMVYVDSGSSDGSVEHAQSVGVDVVDLDISIPFTMARARNAGLQYLQCHYPESQYVQFVDGDCEVALSWIADAHAFLDQHPDSVAVSGNRTERYPTASVYNHLIDLEWQGIAGEVDACGGDAMYRINRLVAVGGFNESMIAGEEAELCLRLRSEGGSIARLDRPMTLHDANMHRLSQWWLRSVRCGHAYAQGFDLHSRDKARYKKRQLLSSLAYGVVFPALFVLMAVMLITMSLPATSVIFIYTAMLFLLSLYIRMIQKTVKSRRSLGNTSSEISLYAWFIALGKFPEAQGICKYYFNKLSGKTSKIIEYRNS